MCDFEFSVLRHHPLNAPNTVRRKFQHLVFDVLCIIKYVKKEIKETELD